jgi:hypothetical protein
MKKAILSILASLIVLLSFSQAAPSNNKIYKHTGEIILVKVIKVGESVITFNTPMKTQNKPLESWPLRKLNTAADMKWRHKITGNE